MVHTLTLPAPLRGIIPPMVTPLNDYDKMDRDGLARLIEHILDGGVHGLFLLGTTGEGPSLSHSLRKELILETCNEVRGRDHATRMVQRFQCSSLTTLSS